MSEQKRFMLVEVKNNGETLVMDDGSEWTVNPGDMPTACIWIVTASIQAELDNEADAFSWALLNTSAGQTVRAMISKPTDGAENSAPR